MSTGLVDICEVKRHQRHLLATIENNRLVSPISFSYLFTRSNGNVKVWTGTYGVLQYPDENGNDVDIYLFLDGEKRYIPAPKFYWKVLLDESKNQAVGFVGLNDPHSDDIAADETFCESVCDQITG